MGVSPAVVAIMTVSSAIAAGGAKAHKNRKVREAETEAKQKADKERMDLERRNKLATSIESARLQRDKARKRTIFAGSGADNIFQPTLGGTGFKSTLGQ